MQNETLMCSIFIRGDLPEWNQTMSDCPPGLMAALQYLLVLFDAVFIRGGCRSLSGTSVASPVVAGAVSLLLRFLFCCAIYIDHYMLRA